MEDVESELCRYSGYLCHRDKLKHYDFCLRHILEDKTAPFKQCTYNIKSQKRCLRPAPRADKKDGYCVEHARKALLNRHKLLARKNYVGLTSRCLSDLKHYAPKSSEDGETQATGGPPPALSKEEGVEKKESISSEDVHVKKNPYKLLDRAKPQILEDEDPKEEEDDLTVDQTWNGDCESDAESLDSDLDTPLRHAGVYAPEEVVLIMRDKLVRLQKSYIDQFQRLQYLLREERRRYKQSVQKEKETLLPIHLQPKESESERQAYRLIKSLNHYHLRQGKDALLASKVKEKRRRASEGGNSTSSKDHGPKCSFNITSHIKCCEPCIPLSKYCLKHIFQDGSQVLFRRCGFMTPADEEPCEAPVANTFDETTCVYHTYLPPLVSTNKSESVSKPEPKVGTEWVLPAVKVELQDIAALSPVIASAAASSQGSPWTKNSLEDEGVKQEDEEDVFQDIEPSQLSMDDAPMEEETAATITPHSPDNLLS